ncbi:uncharacterized protein LOC135203819 [Macrobrachium nipponense]|uniref:uncharacterized protein LOC135203819 n=1 Tax=Macrobrachium nipponense TaxID=159736 RepID=UPI0030C89260
MPHNQSSVLDSEASASDVTDIISIPKPGPDPVPELEVPAASCPPLTISPPTSSNLKEVSPPVNPGLVSEGDSTEKSLAERTLHLCQSTLPALVTPQIHNLWGHLGLTIQCRGRRAGTSSAETVATRVTWQDMKSPSQFKKPRGPNPTTNHSQARRHPRPTSSRKYGRQQSPPLPQREIDHSQFHCKTCNGPLRGIAPPVPVTGPVDLNSLPVPLGSTEQCQALSSLDIEPPQTLTSAPGPELAPAPNLIKDPPTGDPPTGMELTAAHGQSPVHHASSTSPLSPEDAPPGDLTFTTRKYPTRSQPGVLPL